MQGVLQVQDICGRMYVQAHVDARPPSDPMSTDPLLRDCPDYQELAPPATISKKKNPLKRLKKGASSVDEEDDLSDEVRICVPCKKLLERLACGCGEVSCACELCM